MIESYCIAHEINAKIQEEKGAKQVEMFALGKAIQK